MFSVASFLAAFLLFSAQPFLGKVLLPGYGGTAAVWMTCSLFFQLILLFGYGYTHLVFGSTNSLTRSLVHAITILASLIFLPLAIASPTASEISVPILQIIKSLTLAVGVPIFILATSAPLLQKWFSVKYPGENPYWLYALSNAGSLFALLSYPFLIEPNISLNIQSRIWSALFTLYCLIFLALIAKSSRAAPRQASLTTVRSYCYSLSGILVLLFSATGSALMLSATNQLCCELVSIPLLWVLPLTIYLFTFIVIFARKTALSRVPFLGIAIASFAAIAWLIKTESAFGGGVVWLISIYLVIVGCGCMLAHRELFILKPTSDHLTSYYLMLSAGGALGGVFVAVVSPLLFNRYFESGISWILLATLVLFSKQREDGWKFYGKKRPLALSASVVGAGIIAIFVIILGSGSKGEIFVARNFYGVMRVVDGTVPAGELKGTAVRDFFHGNTLHGSQFLDSRGRDIPTTYFSAQSGAGLAMRFIHSDRPRRIGVLGLGVGTLTAYAKQGDTFRIYELDPMVGLVANRYFSYLSQSNADVSLIFGDARKSLSHEPPQQFDILFLDAFTSDSVPTHLLTLEAFKLYQSHIAPDGVIVVNISNRYLDFRPLILKLGQILQLKVSIISSAADEESAQAPALFALLTRYEMPLSREIMDAATPNAEEKSEISIWTDDFSNVFQILM